MVEKSQDLGDKRDKSVWWGVDEPDVSEVTFAAVNEEMGGDGCESGDEFLMLPMESDSVADDVDSSTLNRDAPSPFAPLAWSAISK